MMYLASIYICISILLATGCVDSSGSRDQSERRVAAPDPPPVYTPCPGVPCSGHEDDSDCDGVTLDFDNCEQQCNPNQENADGDRNGDVCDPCDFDPGDDIDRDNVCGGGPGGDNCPAHPNYDQSDEDEDGFGDVCDQDFTVRL